MIVRGVKVSYGIIDQTIEDDSVSFGSSGNSSYSDGTTTVSNIEKQKIAYLEKDYFRLDGTHIFPEEGSTYIVGWESESLSDASGNINEYVEYQFANLHYSYGIQVTFPNYCPAKNFTIAYYNGETLVGSTDVENNTLAQYINYDVRFKWNKVRITFTKVNPQQRARLWQVIFGINDIYDEDMLISVSASRKTDLTGDYDERGEFSFSFFNNGRLDISRINDMPIELQEGLKVVVYVKKQGSDTYTPFGSYYSETTDVAENGQVITVSGYDELYMLGNSYFRNGIVYPNGRSLFDWAEEVAEDAGVTISIDTAFQSIISKGYITEVPHREALRLIAEAGNGIIVIDENGNIYLKKHIPVEKGNITKDDVVDGNYMVSNVDKYFGVSVEKYTFSLAKKTQELGHIDEVGLTTEPQEIEIVYSEYPADIGTIQVFKDESTSAEIIDTKVFSDRCIVTIRGTAGESTFLTITGKPYNRVTTTVTQGSISKNVKVIENNYLITDNLANDVSEYQFNRVVGKYKHSAEIVSATDYDLGDKVHINVENDSTQNGQFVTNVGFNISYDDHTETIEAIDE